MLFGLGSRACEQQRPPSPRGQQSIIECMIFIPIPSQFARKPPSERERHNNRIDGSIYT